MFPDKHLEELEKSRSKRKNIFNLLLITSFTVSFFLIGPFIHEMSHVAWLQFNQCFYQFNSGFSIFIGFYGSVRPLCYLDKTQLGVFYSIGYLSTVAAGGFTNLLSSLTSHERLSELLSVTGNGMLASMLLSVTSEGDIKLLMDALGLPGIVGNLVTLIIVIGVFMTSIESYQFYLSKWKN